jgi:hypothetical protein
LLIYPDGLGQLTTVEGDKSELHHGQAAIFHVAPNSLEYREFIYSTLKNAQQLPAPTRKMLTLDGREDNVYATVTSPTEILWFNNNDQEFPAGDLRLPPLSITAQQLK